jgi:calcineurin-like phosphoesterase family protein
MPPGRARPRASLALHAHSARPAGPRPGVRLLAVSDEVDEGLLADPGRARSADLIVACGDLPAEYLDALMNRLDRPLVYVPGNHDPDLTGYRQARSGLTLRAGLPARDPWPAGAVNADGRIVVAAGLRIAGLGGCLRYSPGPNQYSQRQQARRALALRARAGLAAARARPRPARRADLLLTHAPPRGVGDGPDRPHQGFACYHGLVAALAPAALLHGHVHPYGAPAPERRMGAVAVQNVTGWRLLDIVWRDGEPELRQERRHAV